MELHWRIYQTLELIPNTVQEPSKGNSAFATWMSQSLQLLVDRFTDGLALKQQIDYLERCWSKSEFEADKPASADVLRVIWSVLIQSLYANYHARYSEPRIHRVTGSEGNFWYAYDPLTGQTTYLESEQDIDRWLEERFHREL